MFERGDGVEITRQVEAGITERFVDNLVFIARRLTARHRHQAGEDTIAQTDQVVTALENKDDTSRADRVSGGYEVSCDFTGATGADPHTRQGVSQGDVEASRDEDDVGPKRP